MVRGAGVAQRLSTGLVIERSRVRVPAGAAGEFSSPGSTFCADTEVSVLSPVLLQQHVKDPGHSAKNAGGRLQLNTKALRTYSPLQSLLRLNFSRFNYSALSLLGSTE